MREEKNEISKVKIQKSIYLLIMAAVALVLIGCLIKTGWDAAVRKRAAGTLEQLKNSYVQEDKIEDFHGVTVQPIAGSQNSERDAFLETYQVPDRTIDFAALQENGNKDIYAWIMIPNTQVDYPVLQNAEDVDYYLTHNINGSVGYPGCIYTESYNSTTWEDDNTIIYGHNMKDGSMFGSLHQYADQTYMEEHPYIYIFSQDVVRVYQIFNAYEASDEHLLLEGDGSSEDSTIITLSTCIRNEAEKRFLVQAKLLAEG